MLPKVPVAGLKQKVYRSNKRNAKLSTRSTKSKGSSAKQQAKSKPEQQPTILKAFAKYQQVMELKDGDEFLPDDILDDVWDFDLSQPSPALIEEIGADNGDNFTHTGNITESSRSVLEDKDKQQTSTTISPDFPTEMCGVKRQKSTAACSSSPIAAKSKKTKLSRVSAATKQQKDITEQTQPNFNDPFDELAASQAIKAKKERSSAVHIIEHQWMTIDKDEDVNNILELSKPTATTATTAVNCVDNEEEFDTVLDSFATSLKQQQDKENTETAPSAITSSSKQQQDRESIETIPYTTAQDVLNFTTKDVEDMLFGISTPDIELSPATSPETEKDLASCSLQLEEHDVPRPARRSASQPAPHYLSEDQESTSSLRRPKSYSDSVLETELKAKFDDITNTVTSSQEDGDISPRKRSDDVLVRRSIVDLTQTPGR